MTTVCIVFIPPPALRRSFQRCNLLSLTFSKYIFVIIAVTRIRDKNTTESNENIHLFIQRGVDGFRECNAEEEFWV